MNSVIKHIVLLIFINGFHGLYVSCHRRLISAYTWLVNPRVLGTWSTHILFLVFLRNSCNGRILMEWWKRPCGRITGNWYSKPLPLHGPENHHVQFYAVCHGSIPETWHGHGHKCVLAQLPLILTECPRTSPNMRSNFCQKPTGLKSTESYIRHPRSLLTVSRKLGMVVVHKKWGN